MSRALTNRDLWGMPLLLGVLSAVGLVAALVADGAGDVLSWLALSAPFAVSVRGLAVRRRVHPKRPPVS